MKYIKLGSFRVPAYTEKGNRDGFKTIYPELEDAARFLQLDVKECIAYRPRKHQEVKKENIFIITSEHLLEMYPEEFGMGEEDYDEEY